MRAFGAGRRHLHRGVQPSDTRRSRLIPGPAPPIPAEFHRWRLRSSSARVFFQLLETAMPIPKEVLAILVCPVCKKPVHPAADNSSFKCKACNRLYPVRDGIPVMLPDEAIIPPE